MDPWGERKSEIDKNVNISQTIDLKIKLSTKLFSKCLLMFILKLFFYMSRTKILSTLIQFYEWQRWDYGQHTELIDGYEVEMATQGMNALTQLASQKIDWL